MAIAGLNWAAYFPKLLWIKRVCPLCSSVKFKTAESYPLDRPLRLLALRPVRCVNCWRRYYWFAMKDTYQN
jgi:hypothetical protein